MTKGKKKRKEAAEGVFQSLGKKLDERPEIQAADEALRRAREQLERAQDYYRQVSEQAGEGVEQLRKQTVGDVIDTVLSLVRKHPGPGVLMSVLVGLFVGRLFRR